MNDSRDLVAALAAMIPDGDGARLRFGKVTQTSPLRVDVGAGGVGLPVAALVGLTLNSGDTVALLQQGRQFLALGRYTPAA